MKQYLVFAGEVYYPGGGWNDFKGSYDTLEEALARCVEWQHEYGWSHVVNSQGTIVFSSFGNKVLK